MKFRQFEFRLFPKMKSKKKKKHTLGHADFPRDISLDKNSNFCKSGIPQFYDNLAIEANYPEQFPAEIFYRQQYDSMNFVSCHNICYSCYDLKKSSLPELEINVSGSTCSCDICACATDTLPSMTRSCTLAAFNCETPVVQRTRTRIKTNPWLPSPRATPSPSPTDHQQPGTPWSKGDNWTDIPVSRPSDLPLTKSHSIPEPDHRPGALMIKDTTTTGEHYSKMNTSFLNSGVESYILNESREDPDSLSVPHPFIDKEDKVENSDNSNSPSPVVEFLNCVKYEINFDYESTAEDLLEKSSIPRDNSFDSRKSNSSNVSGNVEKEVNGNVPNFVEYNLDGNRGSFVTPDAENNDITFDDTCNNMQESIDTGYASVSRDSDCLSSDEADDEMSREFDDNDQTNEPSDTNRILKPDDDTLEDVIDTDVDFKELNLDVEEVGKDLSGIYNYERTSDVEQISDLEWDNEPITQTLLIDFPISEKVVDNEISDLADDNNLVVATLDNTRYEQIRDYGSVKYKKKHALIGENLCVCKRRRSRSLADIELSLEDKVTLLREEKTFVQRKIREAILEDRIRDHQMKIFRLLSSDQRKQLIMKTLYDLKTRLEDQSARLQSSYSTVLSLKRMFSQRYHSQSAIEYDDRLTQTDV